MIPAFATPVHLLLRRITFICCTCIVLLTSCSDIPDQDVCIDIDARNSNKNVSVDVIRAYDTTASSISCTVKYANGILAKNWPVWFMADSSIKKITDFTGHTEMVWVNAGICKMQVGNTSEYPCILIHDLKIVSGRGYVVSVTLPTNE